MAGCTMGWIGSAEYRGAKRVDLLLLMIIAEDADGEGVCVADLDRLADETGYPHKTIEASLRRLVKMGKLRRLTDDQGRVFSNVYESTLERRGQWHLYRVGWYSEQGKDLR
jgi:DNA-binding transcriptional ArsR family regulator